MENVVKQKSSFFQVVLKTLKQLGKFIVDDCIKLPAYILAHPLKGFEEFKRYKKGKMSVALLFVVLTIFVNILKFQYDGFLVNDNNIKDLNTIAHDFIIYQGASPKLLGYQNHLTNEKYDKSISVSINSEVFLGKADQDKILKNILILSHFFNQKRGLINFILFE